MKLAKDSLLQKLEKTVEYATGMSADEIRRTPLRELREKLVRIKNERVKIPSGVDRTIRFTKVSQRRIATIFSKCFGK